MFTYEYRSVINMKKEGAGFRKRRMPTKKQVLQGQIEQMQEQNANLWNAFGRELERMNLLLYGLMKDLGKCEEVQCQSCKMVNLRPLLEGFEPSDTCAHCGGPLKVEVTDKEWEKVVEGDYEEE